MSLELTQEVFPFTHKKLAQFVLLKHLQRLETCGIQTLLPHKWVEKNLSDEGVESTNKELFALIDKQIARFEKSTRKMPRII